jgi:hypothetical protein
MRAFLHRCRRNFAVGLFVNQRILGCDRRLFETTELITHFTEDRPTLRRNHVPGPGSPSAGLCADFIGAHKGEGRGSEIVGHQPANGKVREPPTIDELIRRTPAI